MRKNTNYYIRKSHRYLGLVLGIQFLFWTIGGLYFSWNDIDKVHGDHLRTDKRYFDASVKLVSPQLVLDQLEATRKIDSLHSVRLVEIGGTPAYQVLYFSGGDNGAAASHEASHQESQPAKIQLANAETGQLLSPLQKAEAVNIAKSQVKSPARVEQVEYLTQVGTHHEYRGKPLPAWAVTFQDPACTVYISAELGTFQSIRHNQWRVFDFLWMLHTMDYSGRDNFGNILLRVFSVFGLLTVLSGFLLYFISSKYRKKTKVKFMNYR